MILTPELEQKIIDEILADPAEELILPDWAYGKGNRVAVLVDGLQIDLVETAPGVRGNSATGRTKPATLATGHVVQVPEHLDEGTVVKVDTRTGEYLGRAT